MSGHSIDRIEPGLKIAAQVTPEPAPEDLEFLHRMGVEHVVCWTDGRDARIEQYKRHITDLGQAGHWGGRSYRLPMTHGRPRVGTAWTIVYMKALKERAEEEVALERAN